MSLLLFVFSVLAAPIHILRLEGGVDPGSADYLISNIEKADKEAAEAVLIVLDTPGGLLESSRQIVQAELNSDVPVLVYVGPSGARAGSAGVFLTMAAHVAAMAPATNIGAAHPVNLMGDNEKSEASNDPMMDKILNDTVAWARGIAENRNRNADWAEASIRTSESIGSTQALQKNVIDVIAEDVDDLLEQVHGKVIQTKSGERTLDTQNAERIECPMNIRQQTMHFLGDPTILYMLIALGLLCLYMEFQNPGLVFPALIGITLLLAGGVGLSVLPFNLGGLLLMLLGFGCIAAEALVGGMGIYAIIGAVGITLGGALLFDSQEFDLRIEPLALYSTSIFVAVVGAVFGRLVYSTFKQPQYTGSEGLVGEHAVVTIGGEGGGSIFLHGGIWKASWEGHLDKDQNVIVESVEGLHAFVKSHNP
ncbi:MAG: nodulation protein NfeD [Myxococcota bacterium]|nr:nodulation protein NfeD [Myxococcota bacterium]